MYKLRWILKKQLKIKSGFFLKRVNISANQIVNGDSNRDIQFGFIAIQENTTMDTVLLWLPHRKCIVKILIDRKCYIRLLNKKFLKYF